MTETLTERLGEFRGNDLADLCDAAEAAIVAGGGFGWLQPPGATSWRPIGAEHCWCRDGRCLSGAWTV